MVRGVLRLVEVTSGEDGAARLRFQARNGASGPAFRLREVVVTLEASTDPERAFVRECHDAGIGARFEVRVGPDGEPSFTSEADEPPAGAWLLLGKLAHRPADAVLTVPARAREVTFADLLCGGGLAQRELAAETPDVRAYSITSLGIEVLKARRQRLRVSTHTLNTNHPLRPPTNTPPTPEGTP